jgi:TPR repeat protein
VAVATGRDTRFKANNTLALKWLRIAADSGFAIAQTELGEMYFGGRGVQRDLKESRQWLEKAAEARYPRAKLNLLQLRMIDGDIPTNIGQEVLNILRPALQVPAAR